MGLSCETDFEIGSRKYRYGHGNKENGLHPLLLRLPRKIQIRVGALGRLIFPPGYYIYTGSAKKGLARRLMRHPLKQKRRHWHIDFLTTVARVERVLMDISGHITEYQAHQTVMDLPEAEMIITGFGSSDCRCRSHLAYLKKRPRLRICFLYPTLDGSLSV